MLVKEFIAAAYPEDLEISIRANATIDRYENNPMYFGKIKDFGKEKFHGYIGDLEVAGFFLPTEFTNNKGFIDLYYKLNSYNE